MSTTSAQIRTRRIGTPSIVRLQIHGRDADNDFRSIYLGRTRELIEQIELPAGAAMYIAPADTGDDDVAGTPWHPRQPVLDDSWQRLAGSDVDSAVASG
ncbi:MAG: hypothetical protein ACXW2C_00580 [Acidimicrobiia bacterium]